MKKNILIFLLFIVTSATAQTKLDSIFKDLENVTVAIEKPINELDSIISKQYLFPNPDSAITLYKKIISKIENRNVPESLSKFHSKLSFCYYLKANFPESLIAARKALSIAENLKHAGLIGASNNLIGLVYEITEEYEKAEYYYSDAIKILENEPNLKDNLMILESNIGYVYVLQGKYSNAKNHGERALSIANSLSDHRGRYLAYSTLGEMYRMQKNYNEAIKNFNAGIENRAYVADLLPTTRTLLGMANTYLEIGKNRESIDWANQALEIAVQSKMSDWERRSYDVLYRACERLNYTSKAFNYLKKKIILDKKMQKNLTVHKLYEMEFSKQEFTDSIAQVEKDRVLRNKTSRTRNVLMGTAGLFLFIALGLFSRWRFTKKAKAAVENEKDKSDKLLLNILPADIAKELKETGKAEARNFENVSIIFTDFKHFTQTSEKLNAIELVAEINTCFEAFDSICKKYNVEKIKTIGDAYMAASGLPIHTKDSTKNAIHAALEMQAFITNRKQEKDAQGEPAFEMRVGIHTGNVVAGIVGKSKFQYDIWGDTVNTAARTESNGEVGKVNISQATYELIKDLPDFTFEHRGKIEAKGKGEMDMWFVQLKK